VVVIFVSHAAVEIHRFALSCLVGRITSWIWDVEFPDEDAEFGLVVVFVDVLTIRVDLGL